MVISFKLYNHKLLKKLHVLHSQIQPLPLSFQNNLFQLPEPGRIVSGGKYLYLASQAMGGGNDAHLQKLFHPYILLVHYSRRFHPPRCEKNPGSQGGEFSPAPAIPGNFDSSLNLQYNFLVFP